MPTITSSTTAARAAHESDSHTAPTSSSAPLTPPLELPSNPGRLRALNLPWPLFRNVRVLGGRLPAANLVFACTIELACRQDWRAIPQQDDVPWSHAVASHIGPVRASNQDRVLAFRIPKRGLEVALVADGVGGEPGGGLAALIAVLAAARRFLEWVNRPSSVSMEEIVRFMVNAAAEVLDQVADSNEIVGALRTTLIIAVGTRRRWHVAHIGDGGGGVLGADDVWRPVVKPQHDAHGKLAASLGPTTQGEPRLLCLPRFTGDLLLIGSDGIFGPYPEGESRLSFVRGVRAAAIEGGSLATGLAHILTHVVTIRHNSRPLAQDNVTLAALADPRLPFTAR